MSNDKYFQPINERKDLGNKTKKGGLFSLAAQVVNTLMQFGSTAVLCRLLSPDDHGLVAMVAIVVRFATDFRDAGLAMATVQREKITHQQVSTMFWIVVSVSLFIGATMALAAPLLAAFYGEKRLTLVTAVHAIPIVLGGLTIQHTAILNRNLQFKTIALLQTISRFLAFAVAILLAYAYRSYWALVANPIAYSTFLIFGTWYFCKWRPGRPRLSHDVKGMLLFGGHLTGFKFANSVIQQSDNLLLGKYCGVTSLGYYSKAYGLMTVAPSFTAQMERVAIPALSGLRQDEKRFKNYFFRMTCSLYFVQLAVSSFAAANSKWVVDVLFGPGWETAAQMLSWLGIIGIIRPLTAACGWILISEDRTQPLFRLGMIDSFVMLIAFLIGIQWGPIGLVHSYVLATVFIHLPLYFWTTGQGAGPVRVVDLWSILFSRLPVISGIFVSALLVGQLDIESSFLNCLLSGLATCLVLAAWLFFSRHDRDSLLELSATLRGR